MIHFDHTINNVGVYDEGKLAIALISRESDGEGGRNYEQVRFTLICTHILHGKNTWTAKVALNGFWRYV